MSATNGQLVSTRKVFFENLVVELNRNNNTTAANGSTDTEHAPSFDKTSTLDQISNKEGSPPKEEICVTNYPKKNVSKNDVEIICSESTKNEIEPFEDSILINELRSQQIEKISFINYHKEDVLKKDDENVSSELTKNEVEQAKDVIPPIEIKENTTLNQPLNELTRPAKEEICKDASKDIVENISSELRENEIEVSEDTIPSTEITQKASTLNEISNESRSKEEICIIKHREENVLNDDVKNTSEFTENEIEKPEVIMKEDLNSSNQLNLNVTKEECLDENLGGNLNETINKYIQEINGDFNNLFSEQKTKCKRNFERSMSLTSCNRFSIKPICSRGNSEYFVDIDWDEATNATDEIMSFSGSNSSLTASTYESDEFDSIPNGLIELWDFIDSKRNNQKEMACSNVKVQVQPDGNHSRHENVEHINKNEKHVSRKSMIDEKILQKPNRRRIIEELCDTEKKYLDKLKYVIHNYFNHFIQHFSRHMVISMKDIFGNIEDIFKATDNFYKSLLRCEYSIESIAQLFLDSKELFLLYSDYIRNISKTQHICKQYRPHISIRQKELKDKKNFENFLLSPVQRPTRYKLILERLSKDLRKRNESCHRLDAAITFVDQNILETNRLLAIDSIRNCPIDLTSKGRLLLKDSFVVKRKELSYIFLFENIVVFTTEIKTKKIFEYEDSIPSSALSIKSKSGSKSFILINFLKSKDSRFNKDSYSFKVEAGNRQICEKWVNEINGILWEQFTKFKDLREIDKKLNKYHNYTKNMKMEGKISDFIFGCPTSNPLTERRLLLKDFFNVKGKYEGYIFLFDDIVVFTTDSKVSRFKYKDSIPSSAILLKHEPHSNSFTLVDFLKSKDSSLEEDSYTFEIETPFLQVCARWVNEINNILWMQVTTYKTSTERKRKISTDSNSVFYISD